MSAAASLPLVMTKLTKLTEGPTGLRESLKRLPARIGPHARLALVVLLAARATSSGRISFQEQQAARAAAGLSHRQWAEALLTLSLAQVVDMSPKGAGAPVRVCARWLTSANQEEA